MNDIEPRTIAKWFIAQNLDKPSNTIEGNTKIQKLLFFSQLIYMCKNDGNLMYKEEFNAFENGMVLEKVRKEYLNSYSRLKLESQNEIELPYEVIESLKITKEIFGNCSAEELSEMSHQFDCWLKYFKKSGIKNHYDKSKSIVPYKELKNELYKMQKVLQAYEETKKIKESEDY